MADFDLAVETVLRHEGEYSDDGTAGGPTKWGIILAVLREEDPAWADRDHDGDVDADDVRALSRDDAIAIYRRQWWDRYGYGAFASQALATKVFDLAVNLGPSQAHRVAQRAVRAAVRGDAVAVRPAHGAPGSLGARGGGAPGGLDAQGNGAQLADAGDAPLADDGILGPLTRAALDAAPEAPLLAAMRSEAAGVYRLILAKHPEWETFREGWLARAYD